MIGYYLNATIANIFQKKKNAGIVSLGDVESVITIIGIARIAKNMTLSVKLILQKL